MHARLVPILGLAACATVAPLSVHVTGATAKTAVAAMVPARFSMPVNGSDLWSANHVCAKTLSQDLQLGLVDFRELDLPADRNPGIGDFVRDSNLAAVVERNGHTLDRVLLVQPVIERIINKKRITSGGTSALVKEATFRAGIELWFDGESAGKIMLTRTLKPIDYAVLDDAMSVWLPAVQTACARLALELKGARSNKIPAIPQLRENLASMAATSRPGAAGATGIVDSIGRLGEIQRMLKAAGRVASGSEIDEGINQQLGVEVLADMGKLKAGDIILTAQEAPVRSPHTMARLLDGGVVHVEVLREGKQIRLTMAPR